MKMSFSTTFGVKVGSLNYAMQDNLRKDNKTHCTSQHDKCVTGLQENHLGHLKPPFLFLQVYISLT